MMKEFLNSIKKTSVMVVGDIMLDRYLFGETTRNSTEAPIKIVDVTKKTEKLGGAANVALNLKKLKTKVLLFGFIGNDLDGEKIISIMKKNKMETFGVLKNEFATTSKNRILTSSYKHFARFDYEKINYRITKQKEKLKSIIKKNITNVDFIILQDYNKGVLSPELIQFIISESKAQNKPIMADPKEKNFLKYKNITLIKPNLKEAEKLLKRKIKLSDLQLKKTLLALKKKLKSKWILLTLGKNGLCILSKEKYYRQKGIKTMNPDVTGAGDTVICLASLAIFHKLSIEKIAKLSNLSGTLSCGKIGTNPVTHTELKSKLN